MPSGHSNATIISMAVIASAAATLLHEGLGHGVTAWLRGDIPTELTSNHLSDIRADHWVEAAGTLVNLAVGSVALLASRAAGTHANRRYFLWILAALNLLPGAGYFVFSGVVGVGDWQAVIAGLPHQALLRIGMALGGLASYVWVVRLLAVALKPFCADEADYNVVSRYAYYAACVFSCIAGAFDPLGVKLFFQSTVPAAFGGLSGLMWADSLMPREACGQRLVVTREPVWWIAAGILGSAYVYFLGRGIAFAH